MVVVLLLPYWLKIGFLVVEWLDIGFLVEGFWVKGFLAVDWLADIGFLVVALAAVKLKIGLLFPKLM